MEVVNRVALVVTPKRRFMEWSNRLHPEREERLTADMLATLTTVYLVDVADEPPFDEQLLIDEHADEIFEHQLQTRSADEDAWPPNRTPHVFRDWFDVKVIDLVVDASPDAGWDLDDEGAHTWCGWCGNPLEEDDEILTLGAKVASKQILEELEGEIVPFPVGDRTVDAVVVTEDSQAKRDGQDLVFILCSKQCGSELREALERTRTAILS